MENKQNVVSVLDVSALSPQESSVNISAPREGSRTQRDICRLAWLGLGNEVLVKDSQGWSQVITGIIIGKGLGPRY